MYLTEEIEKSGQDVTVWGIEKRIVLLTAPTGCGKTYFAQQYMPKVCLAQGTKMALIVNRRILREQIKKADFEFMLANYLLASPLQVYTYQQLEGDGYAVKKILDEISSYEYLVLDEAHYFLGDVGFNPAAEKSFERLLRLTGKVCLIFMTATPDKLKHLLDESLKIINAGRVADWERHKEKVEEQKLRFIYGNIQKLSLSETMRLEESFKKSEEFRSGEFEIEPAPEPYIYEEVGENHPDYSWADLCFYSSFDAIADIIIQSKKSEKWIVFVNSKKEGRKMEKRLRQAFNNETGKARTVSFISAEFEEHEHMREIVHKIVEKESFPCSVLITTSVLDNGVSISDPRVKNIIVPAYEKTEFLQMLGRRRVKNAESIRLYVYKGTARYFQKYKKKCFSKFMEAFPIIGQSMDTIQNLILNHQVSWDAVDGFTYKYGTKRKFCFLSYYKLHDDFLQLKNLVEILESDEDAFMKLVCSWLGKDLKSEAKIHNQQTEDGIFSGIADKLKDSPNFMTKQEYEELVGHIVRLRGGSARCSMKKLNEVLQSDSRTSQYQIESFSLAKKTFYYLKRGENFPYKICPQIQKVEDLEDILNSRKFNAMELFVRLFGESMPEIFDEEQQVAFLTFCMQKKSGFETVRFRRTKDVIGLY